MLQPFTNRDAATLFPIIQAHIHPGTILWSDKWAAYSRVTRVPGVVGHQTVNHLLHFTDPATDVHTNTIESYWNRYKFSFVSKTIDTIIKSYLFYFVIVVNAESLYSTSALNL